MINNRVQKKKFVYKPRSEDTYKKLLKGNDKFDKYLKEGIQTLSLKEPGKYRLRVLPPMWDDADHYGYDIYLNYGIGPDNQSYLSLSKMGKGKDFLAEERIKASNEGRDVDAKALEPSARRLIWVIDRKHENEGPKLWSCPIGVDKEFINLAVDEESGAILKVDDPYEGYDISFTKEGTGITTKYPGKSISRTPSPLCTDEKQQDAWLDYVNENRIPDLLQFYSYDHIKAVFTGESDAAPVAEPTRSFVTNDDEEDSIDDANLVGKDTIDIDDEVSVLDNAIDDDAPPFDPDPPKPDPKAIGGRLLRRRA